MQRDLVIRAQRGDLAAFSALTAGSTHAMFATARLILRSDEGAADAVQDALLQAWIDLRGLRDPDRFEAWLRRLLVRSCYRAAKRHRTREVIEIQMEAPDVSAMPDSQAQTALRDQLDRGFRRLSHEQRAVIVLRFYIGLSLAESAAALDIPLGTMQSRLNRAMQAMRAAIEADDRAPVLAQEAVR